MNYMENKKNTQSSSVKFNTYASNPLPVVKITNKKVVCNITEDFNNRVKYLCNKINTVEWSGVLFFEASGDIESEEGVVITPVDIYLMDKGSAGATTYDFSEDIFDYYDQHDERFGMKYGHIHSHHNMDAYFSTVDMNELKDNCINHEYYVSIVVNNNNKMVGKVAIAGKRKISSTRLFLNNFMGRNINLNEAEDKEENVMYEIDMEMNREISVELDDKFFTDRADEFAAKPAYSFRNTTTRSYNTYDTYDTSKHRSFTPNKGFDGDTVEPVKVLKRCLGEDNDKKFVSEILIDFVNGGASINEQKSFVDFMFDAANIRGIMVTLSDIDYHEITPKDVLEVYEGMKRMLNSFSTTGAKIIVSYINEVIDNEVYELKKQLNEEDDDE